MRRSSTNGVESVWALLKCGYHRTCHKMSEEPLDHHVNEFSGRQNNRPADTIDHIQGIIAVVDGKRPTYKELTT